MKKLLFLATGIVGLATTTFAQPSSKRPLNVAIVVYPGVEALDLSGPLDVFVKANSVEPHSFNVFTVAQTNAPLQSEEGGLTITPKYSLATSPRPDIIVVPGSSTERVTQVGSDARVQKWLRQNSTANQRVMSVCTGAFIIASAGLLNGKQSTTHWFTLSDFQRQFPKTKAFAGTRFMRDGNVLSTAGVSSGIDGALQLVEQTRGKQVADIVARAMQYRRNTPVYPNQKFARVQLSPALKPATSAHKLALDYDPVCHMKVKGDSPNAFQYKGQWYAFCSSGCREAFAAHPTEFLKSK